MEDFAVSMFTDVPANMVHHIPRTDDKYVVQKEECARIVAGIMDNEKILITGPTGSGKSSLVKYVCSLLGAPFIRINMSADAESSVLFGQLVVREGATVWEDGPITEAVRHGGVVLIDEWELMPPEISMGLQNLLEDDGYLFLKEKPGSAEDKTFIPHKNFRLICAGNTVGQGDETGGFSGTMVQNSATLDRFTTTVCLDYLSKMHEVSIIRNKTAVKKPIAEGMVKLASLIRNAYNQRQVNLTMSPRTLISWGNKIVRHNGNLWFAFSIAYYDKLRDSDKKVVKELFEKVFAEEKA
jgi:cobaltochelatase CobS